MSSSPFIDTLSPPSKKKQKRSPHKKVVEDAKENLATAVNRLPSFEGKVLAVFPPPFISSVKKSNKIETDLTEDNLLFLIDIKGDRPGKMRKFMKCASNKFDISWSQEIEDALYDDQIADDVFFWKYCNSQEPPDFSINFDNGVFDWNDQEVSGNHLSSMVEMSRGKDGVSVPVYLANPVEGGADAFGMKWDEERECFLWEAVPLKSQE